MTRQERALLALMPDRWQKLILGYEAAEWLRNKRVAIGINRSFSEGGGHISLRQNVVDEDSLPVRLHAAVASLKAHYKEKLLSELPLLLEDSARTRALRTLNEIGIETVQDWLEYDRERLTGLGRRSASQIEDSVKNFTSDLILSSMIS